MCKPISGQDNDDIGINIDFGSTYILKKVAQTGF